MIWYGLIMLGSAGVLVAAVVAKNWAFALLYFGVLIANGATAYLAWRTL